MINKTLVVCCLLDDGLDSPISLTSAGEKDSALFAFLKRDFKLRNSYKKDMGQFLLDGNCSLLKNLDEIFVTPQKSYPRIFEVTKKVKRRI